MKSPTHGTQTAYRHGCRCDACRKAVVDKDKARRANWSPEKREAKKARDRAYYARNADRVLKHGREKRYGVTDALFQQLMRDQDGMCAICRQSFVGTPHVDHDHATGIVRGVLCSGCNVGLGLFRDDEARLLDAVMYLRRSRQT